MSFCKAEQYVELLKFLVWCEINRTPVKKYPIGVEILKKVKGSNPAIDPSVRIYIHRLRNKIKAYYDDEGKTDKIILTIPKGHYEVRFQQQSFVKRTLLQRLASRRLLVLGIIIALAITNSLTLFFYLSRPKSTPTISNPIPKDDPIWSDFFSNHLPTTIVIGDHFQFWEFDNDQQKPRIIIDYGINNQAEFEQFSQKFPKRSVKKERHGGLPVNSAWNIYDLAHALYSFDQTATIELSSLFAATQFDLKNFIDRNVIYIGGFSSLREIGTILAKLPIQYKYTNNFKGILTVRVPESDSLISFVGKKIDNQYHQDVGLIAKVAGSNNENYLFLCGFAFPSQIETVRLLNRPELLANLYSQIAVDKRAFPKHFIIIVEILCTEFSAISTKVKYFREIPATVQK
ncbi:MAG: helix-turn-helix domain-containing protein [candidate division KSB1 bacterium]|nr:helix-turn-helix domain-containing protein [candidate division KSB1 bacterium]